MGKDAMERFTLAIAVAGLAALAAGCAATKTLRVDREPAEAEAEAEAPGTPLACGEASYYADDLIGVKTASGAPYDPTKATAAHKTLPFGTRLKVTRGDAEIIVTVTDRGPYAQGRIIDLSRAAAEALDFVEDGVAEVCVATLQ